MGTLAALLDPEHLLQMVYPEHLQSLSRVTQKDHVSQIRTLRAIDLFMKFYRQTQR
jgi:hypothetical protein